ncbi:MAG: hemerythrin domain-containing protein [Sandaracinaceae bacterium]|nr:hemerythrin domain-containing protein [Sandaracinaceae bacterium]
MSELASRFSGIFRDEHRAVRDALLELIEAIEGRRVERARALLGRIAELTGPHFRYEEEAMYPGLVRIFGRPYVQKLYADHDGAIASAGRLVELVGRDGWSDELVQEGVGLVRGILPHVSDCDGLSIMVERLPDDSIRAILDARDRCNEDAVDLIRWARDVRRAPNLPS